MDLRYFNTCFDPLRSEQKRETACADSWTVSDFDRRYALAALLTCSGGNTCILQRQARKARYEMAFLRILSASYCCSVCNFAACAWMIREDEYNNRDAGMAQPSRHFLFGCCTLITIQTPGKTKSRPCVSRSALGYAILLSLMVNWLFLCAAAFL